MIRVLVTGANGFIGRELCGLLMDRGYVVRAAFRHSRPHDELALQEQVVVGDIGSGTRWNVALHNVDCVVHLAARVHMMNDPVADPLAEFRRVNVKGTLNLARQAAQASTQRFIFISSIHVNGNQNTQPFTESDAPNPVEPYAVSKLEAEHGLRQLAIETGMEVVIIRPPLVYGPNARGNFSRLMRAVHKGIPLPLGSIHNKRSFVALDNLVDIIVTCIDHPVAANQTFLAGDGEDVSTTELLRIVGQSLGRPARLIPVPVRLLETMAVLMGKRALVRRLCGSLQVDISKARDMLEWSPPVSMDEALRKTAMHFLNNQESRGIK